MPNNHTKKDSKNDLHGKIIQNKNSTYVLVNKLGSGSYASVWMCYCTSKKKFMGIKMFKYREKKSAIKETNIYTKFSKLSIRNTIKMHDNFTHEDNMCIVFDLMVGSLYDMFKKGGVVKQHNVTIVNNVNNTKDVQNNYDTFSNGFSLDFIIKITKCILESLSDFHSNNIIHGDIKPENILLYGKAKIHDELLARLVAKTSVKKIVETVKEFYKNSLNDDDSDSEDTYSNDSDSSRYNNDKYHKDCNDSDNESNNTLMSNDPELIELSNLSKSSRSRSGSGSSNESIKKIKKCMIIDKLYIENPTIKISDLGSCVDSNSNNKPRSIQTKYYRAPEIILGTHYDESCDIWAVGCTIYELLTGDILFNPDKYDKIDQKRCMMNQIYSKFGQLPLDIINSSPLKQVFYTHDNILKTDDDFDLNYFYTKNMWVHLLEKLKCNDPVSSNQNKIDIKIDAKNNAKDDIRHAVDTEDRDQGLGQGQGQGDDAYICKKYMLIDLLTDMLKLESSKRIKASQALEHPIFKMI
jgi:serine/threonine-protein kinase SRPK3